MALRDPLGVPSRLRGVRLGPEARDTPRRGAGCFVAAALAGAGQMRQSPNVGLRGCGSGEAPLLYITNLQIQVRAENFLPEH